MGASRTLGPQSLHLLVHEQSESLHVLSIVKKEEVEQSVPSQKDLPHSAELGKRHSLTKSLV